MDALIENLSHKQSLKNSVTNAVNNLLNNLNGKPVNIYQIIIDEIESVLFDTIMKRTRLNQSEAARQLGISRGTLRKKLRQYFDDKYIG